MCQDRTTKSFMFGNRIRVNIPSRQQWKDSQGPKDGIIWFTDGSKMSTGTGLGIYGPKRRDDGSYTLKAQNSIYQAEMAAIGICAKKFLAEDIRGKTITVCTDSRASLLALSRKETNSRLVKSVVDSLNNLAEGNGVHII